MLGYLLIGVFGVGYAALLWLIWAETIRWSGRSPRKRKRKRSGGGRHRAQ
jgi:hypothetical protein